MTPSSPWTYLGHARLVEMARRHGAQVNVKPVDFGVIFPQSGGLPLPKRAPQRQAYRLMELKRWKEHLGMPLVIQPKFFPVDATQAACLIAGAAPEQRLSLAGDLLAALWKDDQNLADAELLHAFAAKYGVAMEMGDGKAKYQKFTEEAVKLSVFGAP